MVNRVTVKVELTEEQAEALAQFTKRVGFKEIRENAVSEDDAYVMRDAISVVRLSLLEVGYAPR